MRAFALALTLVSSVVAAGCTGSEQAADRVETAACSDVLYKGDGKPDAIIVSDLLRDQQAMVRVIEGVLRQRGFRAGDYRIGYQSCNSAIGEGPCERNAKAYAATSDVLGMIGPYYSACAALQIPILSRTASGPLAMVSPTNTDPGLTRRTPFSDNDPESLYTDGVRNYVRVVASDADVGAAAAPLAKRLGARRVVVFVNRGPGFSWYGPTLGGSFAEAARSLGLVTTELEWRRQKSYESIAKRAAVARPQLVFLAGHTQNNARRLMEDLRRELGPRVVFAAGDQFLAATSPEDYGPVGEGLRVTGYGVPPERLARAARRFLRSVGAPEEEYYLVETAQAAEVLLDAIARSDGTRASVVEELFDTRVTGGLLGSFSFDRYGDIAPATIGLYSIRNGEVVVDGVIRVPSRPDN